MLADSEEIVALAALEPVEVQVDPPSREYSYPVIAEPPSLGAVQVSVAELDDAEPANDDGVPGSVTATAVAVEDAAPVPVLFVALTRKVYVVPRVSPVTSAVDAVDVPSANVEKLVPSEEYSTT